MTQEMFRQAADFAALGYTEQGNQLRELACRFSAEGAPVFLEPVDRIFERDGWSFNRETRLLTGSKGKVRLSQQEAVGLDLLLRNEGIPVTHSQLESAIWDYDDVLVSQVRIVIGQIRKSCRKTGVGADLITNIFGVGYVVEKREEA